MNPEVPILYMRVEIEILAGQETWLRLVERLTQPRAYEIPARLY